MSDTLIESKVPARWSTCKRGSFLRNHTNCRNWIKAGTKFPPESGRYQLFVSYADPWSSRCVAVINLKGLQDIIGITAVHPVWQRTRPDIEEDDHIGWSFVSEKNPQPFTDPKGDEKFSIDGCTPNTVNEAESIRDLYDISRVKGSRSLPVLWDKVNNVMVSNESAEIMEMIDQEFNEFASNKINLFPRELKEDIDDVSADVYLTINNGVYMCGFAKNQEVYDEAFQALFQAFDRYEEILSKQRYLTSSTFTGVDIMLFVTLVRFDEAYAVNFKINKKQLQDYPNLFNYTKDIYQMNGIADSVKMDHIKMHHNVNVVPLLTVRDAENSDAPASLDRLGISSDTPTVDFSSSHDRDRNYS